MFPSQVRDRADLRLLAHGYYFSCALHAAVSLGIPEALAGGVERAEDLAHRLGASGDHAARLLGFLASIGILTRNGDRFALSDVGRHLLPDHPHSIQREVAMFSGAEAYRAWGDLEHTVRTGMTGFEHLHGAPLFDYLADHPASARRFHQSWHEITVACANETVRAYDFSTTQTVTDIGAGYGVYLATLLTAQPSLRGILFDLPFSLEGAPHTCASMGVLDRASFLEGDATVAVPPMELALLKSVIHLCDDAKASKILANIASALPPRGRVLVVERVIPEDPAFHWSRMVDMTMMVVTGGRERTRHDYEKLYESAGLTLSRVIDLECGFSLVEGRVR
jgi:hypothetical protein